MATTKQQAASSGGQRLMDSIEDVEQSSLAAVRKFIASVDDALPALSDDNPRTKIIDSAFEMVEKLVSTSNQFTRKVFEATEEQLGSRSGSTAAPKKSAAA